MSELERDPVAQTEYAVHLLEEAVREITGRATGEASRFAAMRELPGIAEEYRKLGNVVAFLRELQAREAA